MHKFLTEVDFNEAVYMTAFIIYLIDRIMTYFKGRKESPGSAFENSTGINDEVMPLLFTLMMDYSAIRVFILQFHNGEKFYTGQDILKMTVTHEVWRTGQPRIKSSINGVIVDDHTHKVAGELRDDIVACFPDISKMNDEELEARLHYLNVASMYYFGIRDRKKRIVGVLCLHFNYRDAMNNYQGVHHLTYDLAQILAEGPTLVKKKH